MFRFKGLVCLLLLSLMSTDANAQNVPLEWRTDAEKTDYRETPRYAETIAYCRRLAAAAKEIRYAEFGTSGEGRALPLVIASQGEFTPAAAHRAGKVVVLIQANIHAGETDGKDAGLALLRDMCVTKTQPGLLARAVLFI